MSGCGCQCSIESSSGNERRTLRLLLAINAAMFIIEFTTGWIADSAGLVSDSLDMLADAWVYGIALYAVGRTATLKLRAALFSGLSQVIIAGWILLEVLNRFIHGSQPQSTLIMGMGALALAANVACLAMIFRHRHGEVHMRASFIYSANDVIANVGVIIAGLLVALTHSPIPDLLIGALIAALVVRGGIRILLDVAQTARAASTTNHSPATPHS
jgi:cation diffusion facilitator family transporter